MSFAITKPGLYRMTEARAFRGSISIETWPEGMVFEVTQIDKNNNKVIGPHFPDWQHNSIPCTPIGEDSLIADCYRLKEMTI